MKTRILTLVILITCLFACSDQTDPVPHSSAPHSNPPADRGQDIARKISLLIQDADVRISIHKKLMERFDGDYNFLLAMNDAKGLKKSSATIFSKQMTLELKALTREDPLLQIAMPDIEGLSARDWDPGVYIPVVVYRPPGVDLSTIEEVPAYKNGNLFMFPVAKLPDAPILVISHNERVAALEKNQNILNRLVSCNEAFFTDDHHKYYLKETLQKCGNTIGTGLEGLSTASPDGCDRSASTHLDYITRVKFASINVLRKAEHYLDGNPEVFFIVTLASKNPSGFSSLRKSYISSDRSEWKNCGLFSCVTEWHEKNLPAFNWDKSVFGELVRYDWFEEDYSKVKIDLSLGLSTKIDNVTVSGSVKVAINDKDYFLDQDFVGYCDNANGAGSDYTTGKLHFTVNQQ